MFGATDPDFLSIDDIIVAPRLREGRRAAREGLDPRRVGSFRWLGAAKGLEAQFAAGDAGQIALLLLGRTMFQDRAHRIHLRVASAAVAARAVDFFEDRGGRRQAEPGPAILFGDEDRQEARTGQCADELGRIDAVAVERLPIGAGKIGAEAADRFTDRSEARRVGKGCVKTCRSWWSAAH